MLPLLLLLFVCVLFFLRLLLRKFSSQQAVWIHFIYCLIIRNFRFGNEFSFCMVKSYGVFVRASERNVSGSKKTSFDIEKTKNYKKKNENFQQHWNATIRAEITATPKTSNWISRDTIGERALIFFALFIIIFESGTKYSLMCVLGNKRVKKIKK